MKHIILYENYPAGAEHDPRAPWNQKDSDTTTPVDPKSKEYVYVAHGPKKNMEMVILKKKGTDDYYAFYCGNLDKEDLYDYGEIEQTYVGKDEDGFPEYEYDYDNFEITPDVIERYVNDNLSNLQMGEGIDDYESGMDMVKMDGETVKEIIDTFSIDPKALGIPPMTMEEIK
jgi:hypothetical protein